MGKSTISTGPCSIANCLFTRGYLILFRGSIIGGTRFRNHPQYVGECWIVCLSVCQAVRRAARGRLQLHTYAHNMQTKNLKGIVLQGSLTGPNRFIGSKPVGAIAFHSGQKITDCEYYL